MTDNPEAPTTPPDDEQNPQRPMLLVSFLAPDSAAFELQRTKGISPWMLFAIADHLKLLADLEARGYLMRNAQEAAEKQEGKVLRPSLFRKPKGLWKPPSERRN